MELGGELAREKAKVGKYGVVGKMHLVQCRAYSVKHAASPPLAATRRCEPFMSPVIQLQSASAEHRDVRRRYAAYLSQFSSRRVQPRFKSGPTRLQAPRSPPLALVRHLFPSLEAHVALGEIQTQNNRSHIAMSYEPSIAWKASLRAHRRRFARPPLVL